MYDIDLDDDNRMSEEDLEAEEKYWRGEYMREKVRVIADMENEETAEDRFERLLDRADLLLDERKEAGRE